MQHFPSLGMASVLAIAVTACSSSNALTGITPGSASEKEAARISRSHGWMSPGTKDAKRLLYLANTGSSSVVDVVRVSDDAHKESLVGQITDGIETPEGLAVDANGNLYVANVNSDSVTVYRPGKTSPFLTLTVPDSPLDVAVGGNGYVYVSDKEGGVGVYPPGATSPSRRLTNPSLGRAGGVAVSSSNDVYADGWSGSSSYYYTPAVVEFAKAKGSGKNLGLTGLSGRLTGVIVTNDDLIVTDFDENEVLTYPLGKTSPSSTIPVGSEPDRPVLSKVEHKIFVPSGPVSYEATGVFDYPSGTLVTTIPEGGTGAAHSPAVTP